MYGMPQPNQYSQYGFGGWGGAAGTPGAAVPGMPQPQGGAGEMALTGQADLTGAAGQAAWAGGDPNSYYSNYWGGE